MLHNDLNTIPTFQRNVDITSCIDYIYAGSVLQHSVTDASIEYIQPMWSDHAMLSASFN
jgi:endonuclease/exonuclease/phosphatase family metal-dependent hydrolase